MDTQVTVSALISIFLIGTRRGGRVPYVWIGGEDSVIEGHWVWSSGESMGYTGWAPGQPDTFHHVNEDCARMGIDNMLRWYDAPCTYQLHPLCEIDDTDTTIPVG